MMISALLTLLTFSMATAYNPEEDGSSRLRGAIPELIGADQLADVEGRCVGCQPDYCYTEKGAVADYVCYR